MHTDAERAHTNIINTRAHPREDEEEREREHAKQDGGHEGEEHVGHQTRAEPAAGGGEAVPLLTRADVHRGRQLVHHQVQLVEHPRAVHDLRGTRGGTHGATCAHVQTQVHNSAQTYTDTHRHAQGLGVQMRTHPCT